MNQFGNGKDTGRMPVVHMGKMPMLHQPGQTPLNTSTAGPVM
jgi:hypothetical protein